MVQVSHPGLWYDTAVKSFVLLVSCPDQPGIVARITGLIFKAGCNILALEQHVEDGRLFFMRIEADRGRDLEKHVLTDAVKAAVESRVILHGRRTVVFHPS
jgi:formyltetrahydrofolate deformylase